LIRQRNRGTQAAQERAKIDGILRVHGNSGQWKVRPWKAVRGRIANARSPLVYRAMDSPGSDIVSLLPRFPCGRRCPAIGRAVDCETLRYAARQVVLIVFDEERRAASCRRRARKRVHRVRRGHSSLLLDGMRPVDIRGSHDRCAWGVSVCACRRTFVAREFQARLDASSLPNALYKELHHQTYVICSTYEDATVKIWDVDTAWFTSR
jgi:hypothetical protein